jgi:hypothetical protein
MNQVSKAGAIVFISISLLTMSFPVFGGFFEESELIHGSVQKVIEISHFNIREDVDPASVGLPQKFIIDLKGRVIRPSGDSLVRKRSTIQQIEHIENKLILQGVEEGVENVDDGIAWSIVILKKTGKVILSASGGGVAYVVFGKCSTDQ